MKKTILAAAAAVIMSSALFAGENFTLNSVDVSGLRASQQAVLEAGAPVPSGLALMNKSPNLPPALDMTIKLPFAALSKRISEMDLVQITAIEPSEPILFRQNDKIALSNINVVLNNIEVQPTILIKPYFEGSNRLAIQVTSIQADMTFGPKAVRPAVPPIDKNALMELVMTKLTTGMIEAMNKAFSANKVGLRAEDVVSFSYDRASWTLRVNVVPTFVAPLLPNLISDVNLSGFTFDNEGFALSVQSGSAASIARQPGYNLAISDGMITKFIRQFSAGSDFDLLPAGREGGLKFRADGRTEVAGKALVRDMPLKPNVYFKATLHPIVTKDDTIWLRVERVDVDQAYGIGVPGFLNNWLQGTIISSVLKTVMNNESLKKVMTARKLDDKTVELTLKNNAFLPSFAKGTVIKAMKIDNGLMYLAFQL